MFSLYSRLLLVIAGFCLLGSYFYTHTDQFFVRKYCSETINIECLYETSVLLASDLGQTAKNSVVRELVLAGLDQAPQRLLTFTERLQERWVPSPTFDYSAMCHIPLRESPLELIPAEEIEDGPRGLVLYPWEDHIKLAEKAIDEGDIESALLSIDTAISLVPTKAKRMHYSLATGPFESSGDQRDAPLSQIAAVYLRMGDAANFSRWMARISTHGLIKAWSYVINKGLPFDIIEQEVLNAPIRVQSKALPGIARELFIRGDMPAAERYVRLIVENNMAEGYLIRRFVAITAINLGDKELASTALRQMIYAAIGAEDAYSLSNAARVWKTCAPTHEL